MRCPNCNGYLEKVSPTLTICTSCDYEEDNGSWRDYVEAV